LLYGIGGGALSFGVGLFASSFIYRASDREFRVANPISVGAGLLGMAFFAWRGHQRDLRLALETQKTREYRQQLEAERKRKEQIRKEIERLKREMAQQEAEKKRLLEELEKRKQREKKKKKTP